MRRSCCETAEAVLCSRRAASPTEPVCATTSASCRAGIRAASIVKLNLTDAPADVTGRVAEAGRQSEGDETSAAAKPRTMFEKIWDAHLVRAADGRHAGDPLRRPAPGPRGDVAAGVHLAARARPQGAAARAHGGDDGSLDADHAARPRRAHPRARQRGGDADRGAGEELRRLRHRAARAGQRGAGHRARHRPGAGADPAGRRIVCGDSHTSTHGAFGALAFGIGTSEVSHVLATQCLLQNKPKTLAVTVEGKLQPGRDGQGPRPGRDRAPRHRRRHRPRHRVPRARRSARCRWKSG